MEKERHTIILNTLQSAIGEENVEDSPAVMSCVFMVITRCEIPWLLLGITLFL